MSSEGRLGATERTASSTPSPAHPSTARSPLAIWTLAARPKTLIAAVAPVLMGTAMALEAGALHVPSALCALLGAVLIQIGTNYSNDYIDFLKGADTAERKGPLRVTQAGLVPPATMRRATFVAFALAFLVGLYLIGRGGWPLFVIGALSILCGLFYTVGGRLSLAYLGLADLFVLAFFGPVAVGGTYYVQALALPPEVLVVGLGPGLLSTAILLVNNLRDVDEDRRARKMTLVVRLGRRFGVAFYVCCVLGAAVLPVFFFVATGRHPWAMLTLVILPIATPAFRKLEQERDPAALNPLLATTSKLLLVYSVVLAVGWNA